MAYKTIWQTQFAINATRHLLVLKCDAHQMNREATWGPKRGLEFLGFAAADDIAEFARRFSSENAIFRWL